MQINLELKVGSSRITSKSSRFIYSWFSRQFLGPENFSSCYTHM